MEHEYKYEVIKSLNTGFNNLENDTSTNCLETPYLNEAVNFVKDSNDGVISVIRDIQSDGKTISQSIELLSEDIKDWSQDKIIEEINRRFIEEYK